MIAEEAGNADDPDLCRLLQQRQRATGFEDQDGDAGQMLPIAKQIAESWNGGISPDAAVKSARNDHIKMAVNPINVARSFTCPPSRRPVSVSLRGISPR